MIHLGRRKLFQLLALLVVILGSVGCQPATVEPVLVLQALPTSAAVASVPTELPPVPPTWTPAPDLTVVQTELQIGATPTLGGATATPLPIPTNTPTASVTPTPTETPVPTQTSAWDWEFDTENLRPWVTYPLDEPLPVLAYPRPPNDNGWGMHWMPTVSQDPWAVDRFVGEMQKMHIKWVVFLNESSDLKGE